MPEIEWEGTVGPDGAGQRLDQFLSAPLGSRARAARLIGAGLVKVDGRGVQKRHAVAAGERVVVAREALGTLPASGPATALIYGVPYEDEALIVVDKPAGVVVHPARGHETGTLAQALADRAAGGEDPYRAGIVHRLDRDTSGLLVVAKSEDVHRRLKALLQARELRREYLTLVDGIPPAHSGTIDAPIGRDRRDRVLHSLDTDTPREARTHFELLEPLRHEALLRVTLETGRTHQIRVHMQAIGHPVLGDRVYGGPMRFGLERQFLHAARLAFPHPLTGAPVDVSSPLPDDLAAALELARAQSG
jgi:23S rRNA pseudouridine1911/1915/1917 synthase